MLEARWSGGGSGQERPTCERMSLGACWKEKQIRSLVAPLFTMPDADSLISSSATITLMRPLLSRASQELCESTLGWKAGNRRDEPRMVESRKPNVGFVPS